jgi:hypothetical protein
MKLRLWVIVLLVTSTLFLWIVQPQSRPEGKKLLNAISHDNSKDLLEDQKV